MEAVPKFWSRKYTQSENVPYDSNQAERAYENPIKVEFEVLTVECGR